MGCNVVPQYYKNVGGGPERRAFLYGVQRCARRGQAGELRTGQHFVYVFARNIAKTEVWAHLEAPHIIIRAFESCMNVWLAYIIKNLPTPVTLLVRM